MVVLPARVGSADAGVGWGFVDVLGLTVAFVVLNQFVVKPLTSWVKQTATAAELVGSTVGALTYYAVGLGLVFAVLALRRGSPRQLGWRGCSGLWLAAAPLIAAIGVVTTLPLTVVNRILAPASAAEQCQFLHRGFATAPVVGLVLFSVLAPFVEETVFRGLLFGWLRSRTPLPVAVAVSAALFALAHHNASMIMPLTAMGAILAVVYHRSGSLWPAIAVHGFINIAAVTNMLYSIC